MQNILKLLSLSLIILSQSVSAAAHEGAVPGGRDEGYIALLARTPARMGMAPAVPLTDAAAEAERLRKGREYANEASSIIDRHSGYHGSGPEHGRRQAIHLITAGAALGNKWCMDVLADMYAKGSLATPHYLCCFAGTDCRPTLCCEKTNLLPHRVCCPEANASDLYRKLASVSSGIEKEEYERKERQATYNYRRQVFCCGTCCSILTAGSIATGLAFTGKIA